VDVKVKDAPSRVWEYWTDPEHIVNWNFATPEWHCPTAENDLVPGGRFSWRMEARDGSMGFDYAGRYDQIVEGQKIDKTLDDGRKVILIFEKEDNHTRVREIFEPDENDPELQKQGWQAILENFKNYVESKK
jgi:uncharacterized protein YndB with AHSA1/START domain